jgi:flagellar hook assembly protein FlgD
MPAINFQTTPPPRPQNNFLREEQLVKCKSAVNQVCGHAWDADGNLYFRFVLPVRSQTRLTIYNITGQLVRTLWDSSLSAGAHAVAWDGRDDRGQLVASGEYMYRIEAGSFVEVKKMTFM